MKNPAKIIKGRTAAGETVAAILSKPVVSSQGPEWRATIHCPALFEAEKSVVGVDAAQALELAEMLVTGLFTHHDIERI